MYESPLVERNASEEMSRLFSARNKFGLWRRLWLELARCQRELGLTRITPEALAQMERALDDIDFASAAQWEKRLRHDVMAHVHVFGEAAPAAREIIHLGATSQFVVDNADLIIMRDGMKLLAGRLASGDRCTGAIRVAVEGFADPGLHPFSAGPAHDRWANGRLCGRRIWRWTSTELEYRIADAEVPRRQGNNRDSGVISGFI